MRTTPPIWPTNSTTAIRLREVATSSAMATSSSLRSSPTEWSLWERKLALQCLGCCTKPVLSSQALVRADLRIGSFPCFWLRPGPHDYFRYSPSQNRAKVLKTLGPKWDSRKVFQRLEL